QLFLKNTDLVACRLHVCFRIRKSCAGLVLALSKLFVIKHGDRVSGLDIVALPKANLEDAPACFWRNRRVVTLNPATQKEDVFGGPPCKECFPDKERHHREPGKSNEDYNRPSKPPVAGMNGFRLLTLLIGVRCVIRRVFWVHTSRRRVVVQISCQRIQRRPVASLAYKRVRSGKGLS